MNITRTPQQTRLRIADLSLVAMATVFELVLFVLDSMIPKPVPWIKVGLANIVTLGLIVCVGWRLALAVHLLRITVSAIFRGGFLTPFFLLSFSGGVVSFLVMAAAVRWAMPALGFIGVSLLGALSHNLTQMLLVALVLSEVGVIRVLWPVVLIFSLAYGCFVGFASYHLCRRIPAFASGAMRSGSADTLNTGW